VNSASITMPFGFYSRGDGPTSLAQPFPSRLGLSSGPASSFFRLANLLLETARVARFVLMRSSNYYPQGNCDSPGLETRPDYLTRLGTVSNRSSPPSSFFALLAMREHRQRNW